MPRKKAPTKTAPKRGRPSKLAKARPKILRALADAIPLKSACLAAGIGYSTLAEWKRHGNANLAALNDWEALSDEDRSEKLAAGEEAPALNEFGEFLIAAEEAEARAEAKLVRAVSKKSPLEILKRRFPKTWGDKKLIALEGTEDGPPIKQEGGPPVIVNLTFEDPDDEDLYEDKTEEEEGGDE